METPTAANLGRLERRPDLRLIAQLVSEGSTVLDLGCGEGDLMHLLVEEKRVVARGIEIAEEKVYRSIARGLSVLHGDLDEGLGDYPDKSFDYVVLSQTLQAVHRPLFVVREMLRVGRQGIVSLPNFGYWRVPFQLFFTGRMPKTAQLPYEWYDTPNIHLATVRDFHALCHAEGITIVQAIYLSNGHQVRVLPNLRCSIAVFVLEKGR
ncbi:MAG: methionine biosynthesis protein MetW [Chloroflexi bacterium]|nr:methionine biosynthesis protein MetW [Chloroflexota bacterium]MCL5026143.1 methionine biosynthesis protein MetW [Chloroflexota bacterium]